MYSWNTNRIRMVRLIAVAVLTGALNLAGSAASAQHARSSNAPAPGGSPPRVARAAQPNQHLDARFSHNQYYFDRGYSVRRPPPGSVGELRSRDGSRYLYRNGNWYRWDGRLWIVWGAPIGLYVPFLPPYFTTIWWYGVPYYYANDTYYVWADDRRSYEVVAPPDGIDGSATSQPPASNRLFVYPKSGQSADQQKRDEYECHRWAVGQTGFDPTVSGGGVPADQAIGKRNDYFRAQVSCLEGRGYTVK